jgi:hypothetical protein
MFIALDIGLFYHLVLYNGPMRLSHVGDMNYQEPDHEKALTCPTTIYLSPHRDGRSAYGEDIPLA